MSNANAEHISPAEASAANSVGALIESSGAESVSVAYMPVQNGGPLFINPDESYHAASTMKLCVLMELFHQAEQGRVCLEQRVVVHNRFPSLVGGNIFEVGKEDDSYPPLYDLVGQEQTLIELAEPMITHSSNLATNLLIEQLGAEKITNYMQELGAEGLVVRRYIEDGAAYLLGLNSTVTARGLATVLLKLARGEVASKRASKAMIDIMRRQTHRDCIPRKLPKGTPVANKPGWNTGITHDCAIVGATFSRTCFILAVLTKGPELEKGANLIADIASTFFQLAAKQAAKNRA